jgi:4-amino-4-deoxy-L-arabinose transferase-like glycosyltransferase
VALVWRLPKNLEDECAFRSQQLSPMVAENMPAVSAPSPLRLTPGKQILVLCGLALVLGVQLVAAVRQWSITSDEINHLHAGYRCLTCGDFGWNPEHPPLLKLVAALPLLAMQVNDPAPGACGMANSKAIDFHVGHDFTFANPERMLMAGRAAASLFVFALLALVWFGARKMFGVEAALIAASLLVFDPSMLAHGALVTTDMAATFGFLAAVLALYFYLESRVGFYLIITGVATGIALAVKHSSVLLAPALLALAILDPVFVSSSEKSRTRRTLENLAAVVIVGLIAVAVLWMTYGVRYAARPNGAETWANESVADSNSMIATRIIPGLERAHLLPEAYLKGFQDILVDPEVIPRPAFLLGRVYRGGRWFYFPVAALIKFSAMVLIFALAACFSWRFWKKHRRELLFLIAPPAIFLAASCASNINMGIRHILPVLPFLILFGASGTWVLLSRYKNGLAVCAVAVFLHAASSLHAFPNYIAYSNEFWGGPSNTYRYLADSNVDWGQSMKEAKAYLDRAQPKSCWMIHAYNDMDSDYGIPCGETSEFKVDEPPQHFSGTVIVTASALAGILNYTGGARTAAMFRNLQPKAKLGGSALFVYEGDFDLSSFVASYHAQQSAGMLAYDARSAMREAQEAVWFDARNHIGHFVVCLAAEALGNPVQAEQECNATLKVLREDPNVLADRPGIEKYMRSHGMRVSTQYRAANK